MSYQALARTWRPRNFAEMVGQEHVVKALSNALNSARVHHAYLFTGTRGVGKTTVARILAKCLNCEKGISASPCGVCRSCVEIDEGRHLDLIEVDAASRAKVDETRDLMSNVQYAPGHAKHKIYIIDEVHMFSQASFNALLKTLEEPPPHVKFLLATTDPQKMPVTVLSRCLQFSLKRLPRELIRARMTAILAAEKINAEDHALRLLAKAADGSLRDALSLLDQAIAHGGGQVSAADVRDMLGLLERQHIHNLIDALANGDGGALLDHVEAMAGDVADFSDVLAELLAELKHIAVLQLVPDTLQDDEQTVLERRSEFSTRIAPEDVQLYYQIGLIGRRDLPLAPDPRTGFEMALMRMLAFTPQRPGTAEPGRKPAAVAAMAGRAMPTASAVMPDAQTAADVRAVNRPDGVLASVAGVDNEKQAPALPAADPPVSARDNGGTIAQDWAQLVPALGLSGLARELAVNCQLEALGKSTVCLRLAPEHQALASERSREKLQQALSEFNNRPLRLKIEIAKLEAASPAALEKQQLRQRQAQAIESIEGDPAVLEMIETFDAHIESETIRPLD